MTMLKKLRRFATEQHRKLNPASYARKSFAQEGEDLLIEDWFAGQNTGFYVDVGAHHPYRFSNTYLLYRKGWRGLCIDPQPGMAALFAKHRPRDAALEIGIAEIAGELILHRFGDAAYNTFDAVVAASRPAPQIATQSRPVRRLDATLAEAGVTAIDLLSVDVEGFDLEVLRSNDWNRWRPRLIVAECEAGSLAEALQTQIAVFLASQGYRPIAMTRRNILFERTRN